MNHRLLLPLACLMLTTAMAGADKPSFLKMFSRPADGRADASMSYELGEEDGPWLILASTFVGEGSQQRAERLAAEIRKELGMPAFIYREKFDFTGTINRDPRTARATRYANQYQYEAYAVLAGEYDSVEHPNIEADLTKIRTAKPALFRDAGEVAAETNQSNPITTIKSFTSELLTKARGDKSAGPMSQAFVTRNPMLPEEFFQSPSIDSFVHQMNDGLQYSLLECRGKYTVVVKTFEGLGAIVDNRQVKEFEPSVNRLNQFAAAAEKMTVELRGKGVEAYQFHDRFRSLVTVGSFDTLGRELPGGEFEYSAEIRAVMREYSALNVDPEISRRLPPGTKGVASKSVAMIPLDVEPKPIAVPKTTKRSLYGASVGMR